MSKYKSKKVIMYGRKFDSLREAARAGTLILEEKAGIIKDLKFQVVYELAPSVIINGRKKPALRYISDFEYIRNGELVVEDVKGMLTIVYKIKRHLMKSVHGIDIFETR